MGRGCLMTDSSIRQPISRQHLLFIPFVRDTFFYSVAHISFFFFATLVAKQRNFSPHLRTWKHKKKKTMRFKFNVPLRHKRRRKKDRHFRKSMAPRNFFCLDLLRSRPVDNKRLGTERARARVLYFLLRRISTPLLSFSYLTKEKLTSFFAHPSTPSKTKILKPETCVGSAFLFLLQEPIEFHWWPCVPHLSNILRFCFFFLSQNSLILPWLKSTKMKNNSRILFFEHCADVIVF